MASHATEAFLAQIPLFAGLSPRDLAALSRRCAVMSRARSSFLVRAGETVPGVLALVAGAVRLSLHDGAREERLLRLVAPGETFCLAAAVLDRPSPYQAVTLVASEVMTVPAPAVRALLEHDAPFARGLIETLAARELELCAEIHASAFQSSAQRLASYLAALAGSARKVRLPYSKTLIAARLGMKKETLSRLLRRFSADGVIAMARSEISIVDGERLRAAGEPGRGAATSRAALRAAGSAPAAARRTADQAAG